jgi:hypothetical protein
MIRELRNRERWLCPEGLDRRDLFTQFNRFDRDRAHRRHNAHTITPPIKTNKTGRNHLSTNFCMKRIGLPAATCREWGFKDGPKAQRVTVPGSAA